MRQHLVLLIFLLPITLWGQLTCEDEFILSGTATLQGECIRMTANTGSQLGCAWFHEETDFSMPFTHTMTVNFGNNDGGADGICLVYQSNSSTTCGISGQGIGAEGIPNSFIVEFDTWENGNLGDPTYDHAGININGDFLNNIDGPIDLGNIEDGNDHDIEFSWDPATNSYEVYFDGALIMSGVYDIINNCFGGSDFAYWGYTSSTGGAFNEHLVCPGLPPEVVADAGSTIELPCIGAVAELDGSGSDSGVEFTYEWTTSDGNIVSGEFSTNPTIDSEGTYTLTVYNTVTMCESMDEVTVTVDELEAVIDPPPYLDCYTGEVVLSGAGSSSGPGITYQWSTPDGNIIDENGDQATVNQTGEYFLTVLYNGGVCMEETSVIVEEDPDVPLAFALDEILTCDPPNVELDGTGSSEGGVFDYEWTTDDGIILAGGTTLFPLVGSEGMYTLTVTNPFSGCTDEYSVFVTADQDPPDAIALVNGDLGCGGSSLVIDGSLSSFGDEFTYQWTTSDGNIVSGADEQSPEVDEPGDYTLLVTNTENGCTDQTTVTVDGGTNNVDVFIDPPAALTCVTTEIQLDGSGSAPSTGVTYSWSTMDGQIDSDSTLLQVFVNAPGTYTLVIEETATGCLDSASVVVIQDNTPPTAEAGSAMPFGCSDSSLQLDGTGSSTGNMTYSWTTSNGSLLNGQGTLMPNVGAAGTYTLEVTNNDNGCTATDQVVVPADSDVPIVQIDLSDTLDCNTSTLTLDALGSSSGMNFSTTWSTADGNFVSGTNGLQPTVDQPGTYTLAIVDTGNGCSNDATITVVQDIMAPIAQVTNPPTLDCALTSLNLDATGTNTGPAFAYSWSTTNGQINGATDTLLASVDAPGDYAFIVSNTQNGCADTASVTVMQDILTPDLSITPADQLNCTVSMINLNASLNNSIPSPSFQWSTPDGVISNSATTLQPTITAPGTYQIVAINSQNQCADTAAVVVTEDITPPTADAGPDQLLNCIDLSQSLGGASSSGSHISYTWSSVDVPLEPGDTLTTLLVDAPGEYVLQVTNTANTCVDIDTVLVSQDIMAPTANIALPPFLTCTDSLSLLDGSASSGVSTLAFQWSSPNGSLVGDPTAAMLNAGQAGDYQLVVTQQGNGCTDTTSVQVLQDDNFPTAMIAPAEDLTCTRLSVSLDATANSASGNTLFNWATMDGNIISGANTLQPEVDQPGTYTLTVEDTNNNCRAQAGIVVTLDDLPPLAAAGIDTLLNCTRLQMDLDGTGSSADPTMNYTWTSVDGTILSGENGLTPTIAAAGTYVLEVLNTVNGCTASDDMMVTIDTISPTIQILPPAVLTCATTMVSLDAGNSLTTTGMGTFSWSSVEGNAMGGADTDQATVGLSGTYELLLTDEENGCSQTATVLVTDDLELPLPQIATPDFLTCATTSLMLDGSASVGDMLSYHWSTMDGQLDAGAATATPTVSMSGTYTLIVTDGDNGCVDSISVLVESDTDEPLLSIADPLTVNCFNPQVELEAFIGSNTISPPSFQWSSSDGNIVSDDDTLMPTVDAEGTYILSVTNNDNGCVGLDTILVREDLEAPAIGFAPVDVLDCDTGTITVDASSSTGNAMLEFAWETPDGNIMGSTNGSTITVDQPGSYGLLLTNIANGCTDSLGVLISQDTISPILSITAPGILDCDTPSLVIDASGSDDGASFLLNWSTPDGQIDMGADGLMPTVSEPGTYTLEIINEVNACSTTASVVVDQDDEVPVIVFAEPALLTCVLTSTQLDASASSMGNTLTYEWTTTNGQILDGADGLVPMVGAPGDYLLTIIDASNGCLNDAVLAVDQDITPPTAEAGANFTLDCTSPVDFLSGVGSSQGAIYTLAWSSGDGNIVNGANSLTPGINLPGTYVLLVTNNENGCTATDQVTVVENIPSAEVEVVQPLCFGDAGSISFVNMQGGTPPYTYTINGGVSAQLQPVFFDVTAGLYSTQMEDSNGCLFEATVELEQPDSLVVIFTEPELEINYGDSIRLFAQTNYAESELSQIIWEDPATLSCDDCLAPYASPTESGFYRLTVVSLNGCRDDALVRVLVSREFPIYFPSGFSPNGDGNNDLFYTFAQLGAVNEIKQFSIFDRWGNEVYTVGGFQPNDPRYGWDGTQRGLRYNPGVFVYMAEVELADGSIEIFKGDVTLVY